MDKILKLLPQTWGERLIAILYVGLIAGAVYLPFLEAFAFTPLIAFMQRFSITITLGSDTKTLQAIIFIVPVLLYKSLLEYNKRYELRSLLKEKLMWFMAAVFAVDVIYTIFTVGLITSLSILVVRVLLYSIFFVASLWFRILFEGVFKENFIKAAFNVARIFVISLGIYAIANSVISMHQFVDCTFVQKGCYAWNWIDNNFPNKLLEVGHQRFNDDLFIIRSPGSFGDVNFNGMFALLTILVFGILLSVELLSRTKKGHREKYTLPFLGIVLAFSLITYLLTISRSALLGFGPIAAIFAVFWVYPILNSTKQFKAAAVLSVKVLVGIIIAGVLLFALGTQVKVKSISTGAESAISYEIFGYTKTVAQPDTDPSATDHARLFDEAMEIAQKGNFMGFGLGTFKLSYVKYINAGHKDADPHSTYSTLVTEEGVLGLIVYLAFIAFTWFMAFKMLFYVKKQTVELLQQKTMTRETYMKLMLLNLTAIVGFAFPFMSLATITYYGFFLPFTWWWGSTGLIKIPSEKVTLKKK